MATNKITPFVFSVKALSALKPAASKYRLWDKQAQNDPTLRGFGIAVQPSGAKSWILYYTSPEDKKRRYFAIGKYEALSLAQARAAARKLRIKIGQGIDPSLEKQEQKNVGTVDALFEAYLASMEGRRSATQVRGSYLKDIKPVIGHMVASDVTMEHCRTVVQRPVNRGSMTQANRLRSYLRAGFEFGLKARGSYELDHLPDFNLVANPVHYLPKALEEETPGERFLTKEEVHRLWNSIGVEAMSADLALALKLLLATGQRAEEVLQAPWSEFDLKEKVWTIPNKRRKSRLKKTRVDQVVPLTDFHLELLEQIRPFSRNGYLFPAMKGKGPRVAGSFSQAAHRYCRPGPQSGREPFEPFTPSDMRATFKTLSALHLHLGKGIRDKLQGHAENDVSSRHYDKYDYLPEKRAAMQAWTDWLGSVVSGTATNNVVQLHG